MGHWVAPQVAPPPISTLDQTQRADSVTGDDDAKAGVDDGSADADGESGGADGVATPGGGADTPGVDPKGKKKGGEDTHGGGDTKNTSSSGSNAKKSNKNGTKEATPSKGNTGKATMTKVIVEYTYAAFPLALSSTPRPSLCVSVSPPDCTLSPTNVWQDHSPNTKSPTKTETPSKNNSKT